jgi:hypothetical protein
MAPVKIDDVETQTELKNVYTIIWKDGSNLITRNFNFVGALPQAIDRAKMFCEKMRYKFIHCQPFLLNMEQLEKRRADEGGLW